jgi:hypothetical protein
MQRAIITGLTFKDSVPAQNKYTMRATYAVFLESMAHYNETTFSVGLLDVMSAIQSNMVSAVKSDVLTKYSITLGLGEIMLPTMVLI